MDVQDERPKGAAASKTEEVARTIQQDTSRRRWGFALAALVLVAAAGSVGWWMYPNEEQRSFVTEPASRGQMTLTAMATGDLQPKSEVIVGAEISGMIQAVEVEANQRVSKGQVLLRFDPQELDNALEQAEASLTSARANQRRAQASLDAAKVEFQRIETLAAKKMASLSELDEKKAAKLRAAADLESARASVTRARADVSSAKTKLAKATITSPIDGVVLARNVEGGNTVSSTLQTPELFVLAEDLSQMELHVSVAEADIGLVDAGQSATFSVDAWPDRSFEAVVETVSMAPTIVDNVVTYTAVLSVDNSEGLLRPGMTATATITTGVHEDILRVPNAALRYSPESATKAKETSTSLLPSGGRGGGRGGGGGKGGGGDEASAGGTGRVYVLRGGQPQPVRVQTGRSDGLFTEITGGRFEEGDAIVVGERIGPAEPAAEETEGKRKRKRGTGEKGSGAGRGKRGSR